MDKALENKLREQITEVMQAMDARGLNRGTSGNVSGIPPSALQPEHIVLVDADSHFDPEGMRPSSEWRMHQQLLALRPDVNAVVHCHSRHATMLACAHREIPPPYATFGSAELAESVISTLDGRYASLMANHGQVVIAPSLKHALLIAEEVEEQAAIYWGTLAIGGPALLSNDEMSRIMDRFKTYGQKKPG